MVSRSTGPLRKILPAVAVGLAALLVGCSAGQVTQTDSILPAVNGNLGTVGDIAVRDVMLAHPESGEYDEGENAPLELMIINTGPDDDELLSVSSPAASSVELLGDTSLPGRTSLRVVVPEEPVTESSEPSTTGTTGTGTTGTSAPDESGTESSEPPDTGEPTGSESAASGTTTTTNATVTTPAGPLDEVGTMSIVLTGLVQDLPMGRNVPVTFVFANAGQITLELPIARPDAPRTGPTNGEEDSGH